MWIRSQDGEVLINVKRLFVNEVLEDKKIVGYSIDSGGIELGRYSTKEQALKVLDLIQGSITGNKFNSNYEIMRDCQIAGIEYHGVFQMPVNNGLWQYE